jgi:hypothetical protein
VRYAPGSRHRTQLPDVPQVFEGRYLIPRPNRGNVFEKPWADGETISYVARMYACGRREKITLGTNKQGWNLQGAELETEKILQQIERGTWVPPRVAPREDRLEQAMADLGARVDETFRVFANRPWTNRWWKAKQLRIDQSTVSDYQWRLGYLQRFFGRYQLLEISTELVDRFRDELHDQAHTLPAARERTATNQNRS